MADSLDGLGGLSMFPFDPNWVSLPDTNFLVSRYFHSYPGTSDLIESLTDDVPYGLSLNFLLETKEDEDTFLDFFTSHYGRRKRFWLKDPRQTFICKEDVTSGASVIKFYYNYADKTMRGDERIYFEMSSNGDIVTRELTQVEYISTDNSIALSLDTNMDRDIDADNANTIIISRLLLVRLATDKIEVKAHSNVVSEVNLRFHELVKEYTDI